MPSCARPVHLCSHATERSGHVLQGNHRTGQPTRLRHRVGPIMTPHIRPSTGGLGAGHFWLGVWSGRTAAQTLTRASPKWTRPKIGTSAPPVRQAAVETSPGSPQSQLHGRLPPSPYKRARPHVQLKSAKVAQACLEFRAHWCVNQTCRPLASRF